ncbi:hypothetical protein E2C01_100913 [Portunus trituberculatus]|uniref:Uncharacterized protein n=1 Tax=Portunus trituberculatus TaxID=210409 RepID=A0A5B7K4D0_PORTR|nr:hypothetical protein [Portunus trituberculatus]
MCRLRRVTPLGNRTCPDYSTNQSNNNLLIPSCHLVHCEVNCHPETHGDELPWSETILPLLTCHLPPATCHMQ